MGNNDLATVARVENSLKALQEISNNLQFGIEVKQTFTQLFALAKAAGEIKALLTDEVMMTAIMPMMDLGDIGFCTDRADKEPYPVHVVRRVMLETILIGGKPWNNEINIVKSKTYRAKNYFVRKIREYPNLTDFIPSLSIPRMVQGGAAVDAKATWKLNGVPMSLERSGLNAIPIKVNEGMGADAILGKAKRKLLASVYEMLTGSEHSDGEVGDAEEEMKPVTGIDVTAKPVTSQTTSVKEALKKNAATETTADVSLSEDSVKLAAAQAAAEKRAVEEEAEKKKATADAAMAKKKAAEDAKAKRDKDVADSVAAKKAADEKRAAEQATAEEAAKAKAAADEVVKKKAEETAKKKAADEAKAKAAAATQAETPPLKNVTPKPTAPDGSEITAESLGLTSEDNEELPESNVDQVSITLANVLSRKKPDPTVVGGFRMRYVLLGPANENYLTDSKPVAVEARKAFELKKQVTIFFSKNEAGENIISDFAIDAAPQFDGDNGMNDGDGGDNEGPVESQL